MAEVQRDVQLTFFIILIFCFLDPYILTAFLLHLQFDTFASALICALLSVIPDVGLWYTECDAVDAELCLSLKQDNARCISSASIGPEPNYPMQHGGKRFDAMRLDAMNGKLN
ncbi:uncharacterized protein BDR25DRAFT_47966 [Lindgomyces ingoldianus]|uniref:Uncharacterized protein n=1 Tax=Lindgomyces ingoldianus TaxID=673940 RepID=A0ACB6QT68_9PLEO|nr:uncharacterized protein BDR25DRAFT_47966 [Lindgomyces ingoldianus]KAF2469295.1 hypothetical protein BDR25DRAFT_47966 [Lindgomyces ingoldianus]